MKYAGRSRAIFHPDRFVWGPGIFGAVAPYRCECGPVWHRPKVLRVSRGSMWEPEECEWRCPECGSSEVDENFALAPMKAVRNRRTKLK